MARTARKAKVVAVAAEAGGEMEARSVATEEAGATVETGSGPEAPAVAGRGEAIFIPLNKLKKSPRNARKTPHSPMTIEALAASITVKGMLQNLVVEAELDPAGVLTGSYFVTVGEGRRLAHLLRVKRKEIRKTEPVRCIIDTVNDPHEISLDENVTREAMHPADQFEAFRTLAEQHGWGAEEIGARFGVTAHVVRQRLRLGTVSPKLLQVYREGGLSLDQLTAFAITGDHARQEQVFANLSYNREPWIIRRDLTMGNIAATDRRAVFIGPEAYAEAGGTILRDLFTEDRGGFYEDVAILDRLVSEKLERIAAEVQAEGWKWVSVHIEFPHAHGLRRVYPHPVALPEDEEAAYVAAQEEYDRLSSEHDGAEDLPPEVDERFGELEGEIERIDALRHAYDPDDITRGGAFVTLRHDGIARIERGFIRPEDEKPEPEDTAEGARVDTDGEIIAEGNLVSALPAEDEDAGDAGKPLSDLLVRDLTAHHTLGLRLALGEQPDMALIAVTHALAAQTFYRGTEATCLEIKPASSALTSHADGIEDTAPGKALADRHAGWATDLPRDPADLWGFIAGLDQASVLALFAHCAALTVNAVLLPWDRKPRVHETADRLASALALDMTAHWAPTERTYLGRVTKAYILAAVREAVSDEAAARIAGMKKQPMAEAAEQLLAGTGWLPVLLRTERAEWLDAEAPEAADTTTMDGEAVVDAAE